MIRIADNPVMPSNPWEKFPGSNRMVVVEWFMVPGKPASRHECPKCVNSMLTIVRSVGSDPGGRSKCG